MLALQQHVDPSLRETGLTGSSLDPEAQTASACGGGDLWNVDEEESTLGFMTSPAGIFKKDLQWKHH